MNEFLNPWLLPRPLFAPADEGAGGDIDTVDETADNSAELPADDDKDADAGKDADEGGKTALDAADDEIDGKITTPADWPEDWKAKIAGDDKDIAKIISRYGSPQALGKALKEARGLISSGKVKQDMPDPEDADAMKAWRKDNGVPDDPTGYAIPDDIKTMVTDDDKPMLASFTEFAHAANAPQGFVDMATKWYFTMQDDVMAKQSEGDRTAKDETIESLRSEWGPEYKANWQLAKDFLKDASDVGEDIILARLPDGRMLGNIPGFAKWASDQGRATFGDTAFATADAEGKHNNRKAEIEQIMETDIDRYRSEKLDVEYQAILEREAKRPRK